jgi:hypothetical protein
MFQRQQQRQFGQSSSSSPPVDPGDNATPQQQQQLGQPSNSSPPVDAGDNATPQQQQQLGQPSNRRGVGRLSPSDMKKMTKRLLRIPGALVLPNERPKHHQANGVCMCMYMYAVCVYA